MGGGERYWVLDVPFRTPAAPAVWQPDLKAHVLAADRVPGHLRRWMSQPYTYARLVEDTLNEGPGPGMKVAPMTPRPLQVSGAKAIVTALAGGWPQYLLGDEPGVGKTLTAILAVKVHARLVKGTRKILVIADRPSTITIGHWCRSIAAVGDDGLTWCVVTWDQIGKVAGMGWDVVLADEAHMARHMTTKRWGHYARICGWTRRTRRPKVIAMTATTSHTPLETGYLSGIYAHACGEDPKEWIADFPGKLAEKGLHVVPKGRFGPEWTMDAAEQAADNKLVRSWLAGASLARQAPWGPCEIDALLVDLTPEQWLLYEEQWGQFCAEMALARRGSDSAKGRAALVRFRQKAGMVRVDSTVDWVLSRVEAGRQVAVSCEFVTTAAEPIRERLEDRGVRVAAIYGADDGSREQQRIRFQTGRCPVVVFTPTASLSLHAKEQLQDGTRATSAARVGIFHQPRYSGIAGRQVTGRTHRDGERSDWYIAAAAGTVEADIAKTMINRYKATSDLTGGDTSSLVNVARLLGADWLPESVLSGD